MRTRGEDAQQVLLADSQARDITLYKAPSIEELEQKSERDKIRRLLDIFDRRAVIDWSLEEDIPLMCQSLEELRVQTQKAGIATIRNPEIRARFLAVREHIEQVVILAAVLGENARRMDLEGGAIFDDRMLAMHKHAVEQTPHYQGKSRHQEKERYENIFELCKRKLRYFDEKADSLAHSMVTVYVFGAIDELKASISRHLENIRVSIG